MEPHADDSESKLAICLKN